MTTHFVLNVQFCVLLNLYFKTTCNIRLHFHGPMDGLKIEGPVYCHWWLKSAVICGGYHWSLMVETTCHGDINTSSHGWLRPLAMG